MPYGYERFRGFDSGRASCDTIFHSGQASERAAAWLEAVVMLDMIIERWWLMMIYNKADMAGRA